MNPNPSPNQSQPVGPAAQDSYIKTLRARYGHDPLALPVAACAVLDAQNRLLLCVYSGPDQFHQYPNGDQLYSVKLVYAARVYQGKPQPNFESLALDFFPLDALPANSTGTARRVAADLAKCIRHPDPAAKLFAALDRLNAVTSSEA